MSRLRWLGVVVCVAATVAMTPVLARGQSASASAAQAADEDLTEVVLAEPDFTLVNLPTTLRLPRLRGNFHLTHRFLGNLTTGTFGEQFGNLFGIDNGAVIGFEFRFAPVRKVQLIAYRNTVGKTIQLTGQYDGIRQRGSMPLSVSPVVSVEALDNFSEEFSPALGAVVSRTIGDKAALYSVPIWVHNSDGVPDNTRETFFIGLGARVRIGARVYVVGEVVPRVSGYSAGDPEYSFGIEKRVGGHMFQLTFANSVSSTFGQLARGGLPDTLYLGFNLGRRFF